MLLQEIQKCQTWQVSMHIIQEKNIKRLDHNQHRIKQRSHNQQSQQQLLEHESRLKGSAPSWKYENNYTWNAVLTSWFHVVKAHTWQQESSCTNSIIVPLKQQGHEEHAAWQSTQGLHNLLEFQNHSLSLFLTHSSVSWQNCQRQRSWHTQMVMIPAIHMNNFMKSGLRFGSNTTPILIL